MDKTKPTQGVMINVAKDIDQFLSKEISGLRTVYIETYESIKDKIDLMGEIEELILQQRCITEDNVNNIKLSILREYVYARCPFYRKDKTTKDIRVIVSRTDIIYPDERNPSLDDLYNNQNFMDKAKDKLMEAMKNEYNEKSSMFWNKYDEHIV